MTETTPLRVAIIGTARRSDYLYGPIVAALPHEVELVGVWGRSEGSARQLGESLFHGEALVNLLGWIRRSQMHSIGVTPRQPGKVVSPF